MGICFLWGGGISWADDAEVSQKLSLPPIFSNYMVLQRDRAVPFWGSTLPGDEVRVEFEGQVKTTVADHEGKWRINLDPLSVNRKGQTVTIYSMRLGDQVSFSDVLVGDVWFCSGQSNMDFPMSKTEDAATAIAAANYPLIRLFTTPRQVSGKAVEIRTASWEICSPETVGGFSGVGYYFGRKLFRDLNVPIGLFKSAWGGTRIEPWIPPCGYATIESLSELHRVALAPPPLEPLDKHTLQTPSVLFNGMVAGHIPYAIRGAIWYQGESNRYDGRNYIEKTQALLNGWYELWGYEFPFYFVQIAPYKYWDKQPKRLPAFWEIQSRVNEEIPKTGMAIISDAATLDDIHPPNKEVPGIRLALLAEADTYGMDVVSQGPIFKTLEKTKSGLNVIFDSASGLTTRDGKAPDWFEIAGKDGVFKSAIAEISGSAVLLRAEGVSTPVAVRLAWDEQATPNLINGAGLPTSAFQAEEL